MAQVLVREHSASCDKPVFRYVATVRRTKATVASGTAGKIVMMCRCGATKHV
jgi:hypothetical protein